MAKKAAELEKLLIVTDDGIRPLSRIQNWRREPVRQNQLEGDLAPVMTLQATGAAAKQIQVLEAHAAMRVEASVKTPVSIGANAQRTAASSAALKPSGMNLLHEIGRALAKRFPASDEGRRHLAQRSAKKLKPA